MASQDPANPPGHIERGEPLAIVGMAFKLPQEATTEEGLWNMLLWKQNAMTKYPEDRANIDSFYHPDSNRPDTLPFRGGHFLTEMPSAFDAPFFSIIAAEADAMDPQQRLILETTYHALENAGIPMERISGSLTSVHAGSFSDDYRRISLKDPVHYPPYACSGIAQCMLSNRVSWFYNLRGASITVDTACSGSMAALDISCQGLWNHDADAGIVIGSNVMLGLELPLILSNMNFLSPDGKSYAFDHRANGYGRGEGVGVLIIKRLSTAVKDGDTIRALVRATGSGQDGWTPGIIQPSSEAQENLIRATYRKAGLDMSVTRYVEAHGTGTAVGDPIEAMAIGNAFKRYRNQSDPIYVGSIKSNLGHLEGCSGIAGVIKTVLMLEHGILAPNANFEKLNPGIDAAGLGIQIVTEPIPWPTQGVRRASVSSFGFGGSNSHVVLDDAYHYLRLHQILGNHCTSPEPLNHGSLRTPAVYRPDLVDTTISADPSKKLLIISSADQGGVQRVMDRLTEFAKRMTLRLTGVDVTRYIDNLAYTLSERRSLLNWRAFAVIESLQDLVQVADKFSKPVKRQNSTRLAYAFTGQGAQYPGMAAGLFKFPVFTNSLRASETYLKQLGCTWSLLDELSKPPDTSRIHEPWLSQPLCTAVQIGTVDLLDSFGMSASVVIGHSSGEIAAAYTIGAISHWDACKIAYFRGLCADKLTQSHQHSNKEGRMISVGLSADRLESYLNEVNKALGTNNLTVACYNSPDNVTVSGHAEHVDMLKDLLDKKMIFARKIGVTVAYHSPHMEAVADDYLQLMGDLEGKTEKSAHVSMVSSVTGGVVDREQLRTGKYWVDNMICPVMFTDALAAAYQPKKARHLKSSQAKSAKFCDIVEIGPSSTLRMPILDTLRNLGADSVEYLSVLNRQASQADSLYTLVGKLCCKGHSLSILDLNGRLAQQPETRLTLPHLPPYPFDHSRHYWHEIRCGKEGYRLRRNPRLDLLGTPCSDWNSLEPRWKCVLRPSEQAWIGDHMIKHSIIYPAAGMLVMALEAVKQLVPEHRKLSGYTVKDAVFVKPIVIPQDQDQKEVEIVLRPSRNASQKDGTAWEFTIYAAEADNNWQEKCSGLVSAEYDIPPNPVEGGRIVDARRSDRHDRLENAKMCCTTILDPEKFYSALQDKGFVYGPAFKGVSSIRSDRGRAAYAEVKTFAWLSQGPTDFRQDHIIHPATLDAVFQTSFAAGAQGFQVEIPAMLPSRLNHFWIRAEGVNDISLKAANVCMETQLTKQSFTANGFCIDPETQNTVLSLELEARSIDMDSRTSAHDQLRKPLYYEMRWKPDLGLMDNGLLSNYCDMARLETISDAEYYNTVDFLVLGFLFDTFNSISRSELSKLSPPLQRYADWALDCQERFVNGQFAHRKPTDPIWKDISSSLESSQVLFKKIETSDLGNLYTQVASKLLSILQGQVDPLQFMFEDDKLERWYEASNRHVAFFEPLQRYLDLLTHKNPSLRILEIGAGTGATTDRLLAMLAPERDRVSFSQYTYTDISPSFFPKAKETYARLGARMNFHTFDVEKEPLSQGLEAGSYDVILAASVLHATKDVGEALRNARKLLKPGGKLIFIEIVEETVRMSFAFGLLPGWWLGEGERYFRPWLHTAEWGEILEETGFSGVDLEIPDFLDSSYHEYSVIVTTALEPDNSHHIPTSISVLIEADNDAQLGLAQALKPLLDDELHVCKITPLQQRLRDEELLGQHCISLCEVNRPLISEMKLEGYDELKQMIRCTKKILWVTGGGGDGAQDPRLHMVDGLARVLCTEDPRLAFVTLALKHNDQDPSLAARKIYDVFTHISQSHSSNDLEHEFMERDGHICINRLVSSPQLAENISARQPVIRSVQQPFGKGPPLALAIGSIGLLDTLHFVEDSDYDKPLALDWVELKVDTSGVNFRDCLTALGQLEADFIGIECAGVVTRVSENCPFQVGDRVAGYCWGSYQTYVRTHVKLLTHVPGNLSLTDAAASVVVFSTAWYSLVHSARLSKGESVLIHSAAGGTGQAAIQVAQYLGATVYVTVGSVEKKSFLQDTYGIPEENIFPSRDLSFADGVLHQTKGRGVDVILNSLSGESLAATWDCIAPLGRFIEIGNRDIMNHAKLSMWPLRKATTFSHVAVHIMLAEDPDRLLEVGRTVLKLIAQKTFFVPKPLKVYGISQVAEVFRQFQGGQNYGRSVVQMKPDDLVDAQLKPDIKYKLDTCGTYIITGGLGGIGRSIAWWMVERGARNLILLSRSGAQSPASQELVRLLTAAKVNVQVPRCDIGDKAAVKKALDACTQLLPPIVGCIQAAMVLKDALYENMTFEEWQSACSPKVEGTWNLHTILPPHLDFFVCLSSLSCIVGNVGQANYAAGNAFMDELVRHRVLHGQHAITINLGWVEEEGVVAENSDLRAIFSKVESMPRISMTEVYALLDYACDPTKALSEHQVITGLAPPTNSIRDAGAPEVPWLRKPMVKQLMSTATNSDTDGDQVGKSAGPDYADMFQQAKDEDLASQVVYQCVKSRLSRALSVSEDDIDMSLPFHALGVDSLFGIELRSYLSRKFESDVAMFELMGAMSADAACTMIASRSTLRKR